MSEISNTFTYIKTYSGVITMHRLVLSDSILYLTFLKLLFQLTREIVTGLKVLIKNNKCLEVIRTISGDNVDFPTLEELNPRITRHFVRISCNFECS